MGDNGIAAVDDLGIIATFVEHAEVDAHSAGIVHVAAHGPLVRAG